MRSLDEIREALAERERNRPKVTSRPGRRTAGRRHTARTKAKLSDQQRVRRRGEALADPNTHPLRRSRVTFNGEGITQGELAELALVSKYVIQDVEAGRRQPSRLTAQRLARALKSSPAALGLE